MGKNLQTSFDRYLVNFRFSQLNRWILSSKIGAVKKKLKYHFFNKNKNLATWGPHQGTWAGLHAAGFFLRLKKKVLLFFFNGYSTGLLLYSDWHYQYICPNSLKFGTFWLQIIYIIHIIHMENIIGHFFYQKLIFWAKNWFLGLKIDFWG